MSNSPLPTLAEAGRQIAAGELSPVTLTEAALARAEALQPRLDAFIEITAERALAAAKRAEREIAGGRRRGPLHGIPYGLKDIFTTPPACARPRIRAFCSTISQRPTPRPPRGLRPLA